MTLKGENGPPKIVSSEKNEPPKRSPIGEYDQSILCVECEAMFSPWDNYAHEILVKRVPVPVFFHDGEPQAGQINDCDMHKLKMFFISLLWRMHITDRSMFNGVDVGPYYEKIKSALRSDDSKLVPELDVVVTRFEALLSDSILSPTKSKIYGVNTYWIHFARHSCRVKLDQRPFPKPFDELAISRGAPFHILNRDFDDSPELLAMKEIVRSRRG